MSLTALSILILNLVISQQNSIGWSFWNNGNSWKRSSPANYWWEVDNPWKNLRGLQKKVEFPRQFLDNEKSRPISAEAKCHCVPTLECDPETGKIFDYGEGKVDFRTVPTCPADMVCCFPEEGSSEEIVTAKEPTTTESVQRTAFSDCGIVTDLYTVRGNEMVTRFNEGNDRIETDQGQFPWTLALMLKTEEGEMYKCGATLLYATIAITAAHCVDKSSPEKLTIVAGEWDLTLDGEIIHPQQRTVKSIRIHPNYSRRPIKNDIALLKVDAPFKSNELVNNICLPKENDRFEKTRCHAAGWNVQADGSTLEDRKLKKAKLSILPLTECQALYQRRDRFGPLYKMHHSFLCAVGINGEDTCMGDGGGPLTCTWTEDERHYLAGVTSWGFGCGKAPGAYSNVAIMLPWINQAVDELLL